MDKECAGPGEEDGPWAEGWEKRSGSSSRLNGGVKCAEFLRDIIDQAKRTRGVTYKGIEGTDDPGLLLDYILNVGQGLLHEVEASI